MMSAICHSLAALRRAIRPLETIASADDAATVSFGIRTIDAALGGGLAGGMLHEVAAASESDFAAATGFVLALAARQTNARRHREDQGTFVACLSSVVWIAEDMALTESAAPYGPGLDDWLAPERLLLVRVAKNRDVAWVMEEALRCRAVSMVVGEVRKSFDLVATRRLSLAAGRGGGVGLLLRTQPGAESSAAATRWVVGAASSNALGPPRLCLRLVRNRCGHLGSWMVELNHADQRFDPASAHLEPVVQPALDRPHHAAVA